MKWVCLFLSGLFFGGAIDHVILAIMRKGTTPYGLEIGVNGNWLMAMADLAVTGLFLLLFYRITSANE